MIEDDVNAADDDDRSFFIQILEKLDYIFFPGRLCKKENSLRINITCTLSNGECGVTQNSLQLLFQNW